jgi:hypothetical protein
MSISGKAWTCARLDADAARSATVVSKDARRRFIVVPIFRVLVAQIAELWRASEVFKHYSAFA